MSSSLSKITTITSSSTKNSSSRILYNFWRGHPNNDLLPVSEMQEILHMMSTRDPTNQEYLQSSLQYLTSDRGDPALLKEISLFLKRRTQEDELPTPITNNNYNNNVYNNNDRRSSPSATVDSSSPPSDPELNIDMFLTHGVSHGLDLLCTAQTKQNDLVLVERPTYFLAADIFKAHNLRVQYIPMTRHPVTQTLMVNVDALAQGFMNGSIEIPRMIYIVPTHQNPTGNTMPLADRWLLVKLARQYEFLVAADEVYHLLDWSSPSLRRPARFSVLDHLFSKQQSESLESESTLTNNNVNTNLFATMKNNKSPTLSPIWSGGCSVSVNSFTKIFAPGVRCGWIEGPTSIIDSLVDIGYIQSQGSCVPFVGNVLRTALTGGFQDRILNKLNASYQERSNILCDILDSESGIQIHHRPNGGYFCWVEFLHIPSSNLFANFCLERGLKFMPGSMCDPVLEDDLEQSQQSKELCKHSARLCFAYMDTNNVSDGAKLLVKLYREYIGTF